MDWWQQQLLSSILKLFSFFYASKHSFFPLYRISHSCSWISGTVLTVYMNVYVLMFRRTFSWIFCSMFFFLFLFFNFTYNFCTKQIQKFSNFFRWTFEINSRRLKQFVCVCVSMYSSLLVRCLHLWMKKFKKKKPFISKKKVNKSWKMCFLLI